MKLYIDFDGVILDTLPFYLDIINEAKDLPEEDRIILLSELDWSIIVEGSDEINNSIDNIKKIIESNKYDVSILTHCNSNQEFIEKEKFIRSKNIDIPVIPVFRPTQKIEKVDPKNAILIDDDINNLILWEEQGGIGIYFSNNENNYLIKNITSLEEVLDF